MIYWCVYAELFCTQHISELPICIHCRTGLKNKHTHKHARTHTNRAEKQPVEVSVPYNFILCLSLILSSTCAYQQYLSSSLSFLFPPRRQPRTKRLDDSQSGPDVSLIALIPLQIQQFFCFLFLSFQNAEKTYRRPLIDSKVVQLTNTVLFFF